LAAEVEQRLESEQTAHGARLQAEAANRARAQFLANISHDVLTPLNGVTAYAEMIDNEILGPLQPMEYRSYAADVRLASGQLHDLIRSLLETARVETGNLQITASAIDLAEVLHETLVILDHQAKHKGISLTDDSALKSLPMSADPVLLRRLMLNLTTNALKFTETGGRARVSLEPDGKDGAILRIADTGRGIAAADIETALTPYGQVGGALDDPDDPGAAAGLGLGLPMAKAIAEAHGGSMSVESEVGVGTIVTVQLPSTDTNA
jgi:signal transduction histidine kinase